MPRQLRPPLNVRIWEFVDRSENDKHWLWHGNFDHEGQPVVVLNKADWETFDIGTQFGTAAEEARSVKLTAARAMWGLLRGNVPLDRLVLRTCGARACVNPHHCTLGLVKDVQEQTIKRNRKPSGSKSVKAILTDRDVQAIVKRYSEGGISQKALGEQFGVSQVCVGQIITGETWASVTGIKKESVRSRWRRNKSRQLRPPKLRFRDA